MTAAPSTTPRTAPVPALRCALSVAAAARVTAVQKFHQLREARLQEAMFIHALATELLTIGTVFS